MRLTEKALEPYAGAEPYLALASPDEDVRRRLSAVLRRYPRYEQVVLSMFRQPQDLSDLDDAVRLFLDAQCRADGLQADVSSVLDTLRRLSAGAAEHAAEALAQRLADSRLPNGSWPLEMDGAEEEHRNGRASLSEKSLERAVLRTTLAVYALDKWAHYLGSRADAGAVRAARTAGRRWLRANALPDLWSSFDSDAGADINVPDSSFAFVAMAYGRGNPPSLDNTVKLLLQQMPDGAWRKSALSDEVVKSQAREWPAGLPDGDVGATALSVLSLALLRQWLVRRLAAGGSADDLRSELGLAGSVVWNERAGGQAEVHPYDAVVDAMIRGAGWLTLQQLPGGGWASRGGYRRPQARVISTCLAISALVEARGTGAMPSVVRGLDYLVRRSREADDGTVFWPSDRGPAQADSQISSTALAVGALAHVSLGDMRSLADRSVLWLVGQASETTSTTTAARLLCSLTDYLGCRHDLGTREQSVGRDAPLLEEVG